MEPIVSRSLVIDQARRAVESGQPLHQFQAWPIGTAAGQLFLLTAQHMRAVIEASKRVQEGVHG